MSILLSAIFGIPSRAGREPSRPAGTGPQHGASGGRALVCRDGLKGEGRGWVRRMPWPASVSAGAPGRGRLWQAFSRPVGSCERSASSVAFETSFRLGSRALARYEPIAPGHLVTAGLAGRVQCPVRGPGKRCAVPVGSPKAGRSAVALGALTGPSYCRPGHLRWGGKPARKGKRQHTSQSPALTLLRAHLLGPERTRLREQTRNAGCPNAHCAIPGREPCEQRR